MKSKVFILFTLLLFVFQIGNAENHAINKSTYKLTEISNPSIGIPTNVLPTIGSFLFENNQIAEEVDAPQVKFLHSFSLSTFYIHSILTLFLFLLFIVASINIAKDKIYIFFRVFRI